ncbi:hypothetical protein A1Q1_07655 [Trichosporon asahii var. asahii CBS 2479]|uniref:Uncharacterized protein n=1 Tax=Trichosporon asahii var. asahii (strain ATCC 90039 / CBS 2479 / JCM 2466 / KCTC 7840 / NBRC 103889/ NCYC 2677 / UAMH 7654) TaxID=1186058 RepID=J5TJA0_TRIAS|nr:hypothetical protein A1Q1_07655 [Trichosporon asahii var. asahii CBS 2479]EJT51191.1 hypothetical protein A1Q1_07655 [Trichosporon asahii var. asahii CBS 2479]
MPRSSRGSVRPSSSHSAPSGSRQAHTASYPQQHAPAPAQHYPAAQPVPAAVPQKQPGLMAQAASTMGGAVAGSVVGHGISNMLFGSSRPAEAAPPPPFIASVPIFDERAGISSLVEAPTVGSEGQ